MKKNRIAIGFDWIQLTAMGEMPYFDDGLKVNEDIYLYPKDYRTRFYNSISDIYYKGQAVAEIEYHPHSKVLHPLSCMIKLKNEVCYETGISKVITDILDALNLEFNNWTRIDFCMDGHGLLEPLRKAMISALTGQESLASEIRLVGKSDITTRVTHNGKIKGVYVGARTSDKSLCGYNKSLEIKLSKKMYIKDWWIKNGISEKDGDIERLEFRVKGSELKRYKFFDKRKETDPIGVLDRLMKAPEMFESLLHSLSKKLYEFIDINEARSDEAPRLFPITDFLVNASKKMLNKASRLANSELSRMKQAAKTLYWIGKATGRKFYNKLSKDVARMVDHSKWQEDSIMKWVKEYHKRDGDRRFEFLSHLTDDPQYEQMKLFDIPIISKSTL